jgi:hypothetical protein
MSNTKKPSEIWDKPSEAWKEAAKSNTTSTGNTASQPTDTNVKVVFGIQPSHIELIESERKRWNEIPLVEKSPDIDMIYSKGFWEQTARIVGWEPFTLALNYFEFLTQSTPTGGNNNPTTLEGVNY